MIQLSALTIYPIKACRGIDVSTARVERMGLERDRRMMLITPEGEFLTQREFPKLALVSPELKNGTVILTAPKFDSLRVDVQTTGATRPVNVWKSKGILAVDQGDEAAQWFSDWLDASVRLVHIADGFKRSLNPDYAVSADDRTGFADGYPILIISEESLGDLNLRLEAPVPMNRFRPNLVVKGCDPFAEDKWKRIKIGGVEMAIVKPCPRCVVTTIDKETLEQNNEPLKTLSVFRRHVGGVMFGQNVIPLNESQINVGDEVVVVG